MNVKNSSLYEAGKSYVIAAIDLLNQNPDDRFDKSEWSDSFAVGFILSHDKLKQLSEYKKCQEVLEEDSILASQLNMMIGVETGGHISPDIDTLMVRLPNLGVYGNTLKFNAEHFDREYKNFEDAFYNNKIRYEVIVPVTGHLFSRPLKLSPTLEICLVIRNDLTPVNSEEIANDPYLGKSVWAIRAQYELPKIIGGSKKYDSHQAKKNDKCQEDANNLIEKLISCLRLYGVSNVFPEANIHRTSSLLFSRSHLFPVKFAPSIQPRLIFDKAYSENFIEFWKNFEFAVNNYPAISIAAKRLSYSYERHDLEDNIIDLSIAAEALFLSNGSEKTELSYRLKLHAALFLGEDDIEMRKRVFDDMGLAYNLRSAIAHGGEPDNVIKKIERSEIPILGEDYKLEQFISRIRHYLIETILKMINLAVLNREARDHSKKLIDWNNLVLGIKETKIN